MKGKKTMQITVSGKQVDTGEALRQHVADRGGNVHDLVILSHDVAAVAARHAAYGTGEAGA